MKSETRHQRRSKRRPARRITDDDAAAIALLLSPPESHVSKDAAVEPVNNSCPLATDVNRNHENGAAER